MRFRSIIRLLTPMKIARHSLEQAHSSYRVRRARAPPAADNVHIMLQRSNDRAKLGKIYRKCRASASGRRTVPDLKNILLGNQDFNGRGGGIRTHDPLTPSQVRYRAALRPDLPLRPDPIMISGSEAQAEKCRPGLKRRTTHRKVGLSEGSIPIKDDRRSRRDTACLSKGHGGLRDLSVRLSPFPGAEASGASQKQCCTAT